jgi:Kef-type K+ transport system membrane component KefB
VAGHDLLLHVLLALLVILVVARLVGAGFRRIGQPPVIGEVVAGILLGPSLLGRVWPAGFAFLLPTTVSPYLQVIAQVGVILYMFVVGLELDPTRLRKQRGSALAISQAGILVPFALGVVLALALYPAYAGAHIPFPAFALFLGVAMAVTAFPVLARILTDRGMQQTPLGTMALACAAVDDVTAWCLLAFASAAVTAHGTVALRTLALTAVFIALVLVVLRPGLARLARRVERARGEVSLEVVTAMFALLLLAALATEWIGIHALFGAFLVGVAVPHDSALARDLKVRLHDLVTVLLLPAFFAFSGLRTQLGLVHGGDQWLAFAGILFVACLGKFGGATIAARMTGMPWRTATALGVLMNTRGLVELIVLNVGLDLGVISPPLFAMLVLMALVTTFATSPILARIVRPGPFSSGLPRAIEEGIVTIASTVAGVACLGLGVVSAFCIIPLLPMTLISTGMRLLMRRGRTLAGG